MFKINLFDFAVFNVADIFITVFSIAFILYILFGGEKEREPDADEFDEDDYEDERLSRRTRSSSRYAKDEFEEEEEVPARRSRRARKATARLDEEEEDVPTPQSRRGRKAEDEEAVSPKKDRKARRSARDDDEMFEEMFGTKIAPAPASARKAEVAEKAPVRRPASQPARKASSTPSEPQSNTPAPARRQAVPAKSTDSDPFAEWEKANARVNASRRTSFEEEFSEPSPDTFSQDAFSEFVASSAKKPAAPESVKQAPVAKPAPAPAEPEPAAAVSIEEDFDLDSILNEFK